MSLPLLAATPGLTWYFLWRGRDRPATDLPRAASVAVLPFVNHSDDKENEYFSDGMTEEIINALANVEGLRVVARTSAFSFKGKDVNVRKIGEELNVATVLEGSVRRDGNLLRVSAQLIGARDGYHLWARIYDRELKALIDARRNHPCIVMWVPFNEGWGQFDTVRVVEWVKKYDPSRLVNCASGRFAPAIKSSRRCLRAHRLFG